MHGGPHIGDLTERRGGQLVSLHTVNLAAEMTTQQSDFLDIGNGMCGIEWSSDRWCHVTQKGQSHDLVIFRFKYLENGLR